MALTDEQANDMRLREVALQAAITATACRPGADVLTEAKAFYAFLKGTEPTASYQRAPANGENASLGAVLGAGQLSKGQAL